MNSRRTMPPTDPDGGLDFRRSALGRWGTGSDPATARRQLATARGPSASANSGGWRARSDVAAESPLSDGEYTDVLASPRSV